MQFTIESIGDQLVEINKTGTGAGVCGHTEEGFRDYGNESRIKIVRSVLGPYEHGVRRRMERERGRAATLLGVVALGHNTAKVAFTSSPLKLRVRMFTLSIVSNFESNNFFRTKKNKNSKRNNCHPVLFQIGFQFHKVTQMVKKFSF